MPIAQLTTVQADNTGRLVRVDAPIVLTHKNGLWSGINPNNNNVLLDGLTTVLIRRELANGWLSLEPGWDVCCGGEHTSA